MRPTDVITQINLREPISPGRSPKPILDGTVGFDAFEAQRKFGLLWRKTDFDGMWNYMATARPMIAQCHPQQVRAIVVD